MKTVVGVFFGGKSVEHEVSIISALQVIENLDREKYEVVPVYISKDNKFYISELLTKIEEFKNLDNINRIANEVYFTHKDSKLIACTKGLFSRKIASIDIAFPVVHGLNVEDGTLEGFLEMYNIPYVGCDVCASAVGMNKIIFKKVLEASNIPVIEYDTLNISEFEEDEEKAYQKITSKLELPVIVKPANLGSSVGIEIIKEKSEFKEKMQQVFEFCENVLVERCVTNLREINCSVLGNYSEQEVSVLEEPIKNDEILSYKDKYMSGGAKGGKLGQKFGQKFGPKFGTKASGMASLSRKIPAELTKNQEDEIYTLAVDTFRALNCEGISRIDFILDNDKIYVNEINTIPGSLSYYLWQPKGIEFPQLLDKAIRYAIKRKERRDKITYSTDVNILNMNGKK